MDNTRPHTAARTQEYLTRSGATLLKQSPYSPDLNLCDRFLFTRLQEHRRKHQYLNSEEVLCDVQQFVRQLPESMIVHELQKLKEHAEAVIRQSGCYITN